MAHPRIVFVAETPWERPLKIARALKAKGISVLLIYFTAPNNCDPQEYVDFAIKVDDPKDVVGLVKKISPDIVHIFSYWVDQLAYNIAKAKLCKTIYDYKDCYENVLPVATDREANHWALRGLLSKVDAVCCRDLQFWHFVRVNRYQPIWKQLLFLDYCWGDEPVIKQRKGKDEVHTVIAGHIYIEKKNPDGADCGYLHTARALVSQGVHVHLYPRWHFDYLKDNDDLSDYVELESQSPYFHMHEPVSMSNFVAELSQYDYGLGVLQGALFKDIGIRSLLNGHERYGIPSRWYDYVEAGLDNLISPEMRFGYRVLRNSGAAYPVTPSLFTGNQTKRLLLERLHDAPQRIENARKKLSINNNIHKLVTFYKSL
jgi:hypothetical protein